MNNREKDEVTMAKFPAGPLDEPVSFVITVAPESAARYLKDAWPNRRITPGRVDAWERVFRTGQYKLNHQGIAFAWDAARLQWRLSDGQHRLTAVARGGFTFRTFAAFGASTGGVDQGRPRTFADALGIREQPNSYVVAAITRLVAIEVFTGIPQFSGTHFAPTTDELELTADEYPCLLDTATFVKQVATRSKAKASVVGWFRWKTAHFYEGQCKSADDDWFLDRLADGSNLTLNHPVLALRNRLLSDKKFRASSAQSAQGFVRAWNAYRQHRPLSRIQVDDLAPADFPAMKR